MKVREEKLRTIIEWSEKNEDVRVLLLTSSLVNPLALVDEFSDLDIEFVFEDNTNYISDKSWTLKFGNPIAMIEEDESCFNHKHAMKMLLYEDGVKVDFKLYSKSKFIKETQEKELPEDWDIGYKILIDKDGITKQMLKPTYQISIIKKPSEKEFQNLINDFWWDTTYVAKCLVRDEIFYAKFMSETVIRTEYLIPLIEWHIASEHNWNITTNKYGRLFKKYLNQEMWAKTEQTFSGSDIKENWTALFSMTDLVSEIGTELSKKLEYKYPDKLENDIRKYLAGLKHLSKSLTRLLGIEEEAELDDITLLCKVGEETKTFSLKKDQIRNNMLIDNSFIDTTKTPESVLKMYECAQNLLSLFKEDIH